MVGELCIRDVIVGQRGEAVVEAARRMREAHVGDLVVVENLETRLPVGMLTDRDVVVSAVAMSSGRLADLTVGDIMTSPAVTARESDSLDTALATMERHGVRRLVVLDPHGILAGILAVDDIVEYAGGILSRVAHLFGRERQREEAKHP